MPIDEHDLRHLARELKQEYQHLHELKDSRPTPPEVRVMKPAPGPQTPGNWLMMSLYIDQEQRLREVAFDAFRTTGIHIRDTDCAAPRLLDIIAYNAQALSELDWAEDLAEELTSQARIIHKRCNPTDAANNLKKRAQSHHQLYTAAQAAQAAQAVTGKPITRKTVTYWGNAGYITAHHDINGKACYRLSDVITHAEKHT